MKDKPIFKIGIPIIIALFFIASFSLVLGMQFQIKNQLTQINESMVNIQKAIEEQSYLLQKDAGNDTLGVDTKIEEKLKDYKQRHSMLEYYDKQTRLIQERIEKLEKEIERRQMSSQRSENEKQHEKSKGSQ